MIDPEEIILTQREQEIALHSYTQGTIDTYERIHDSLVMGDVADLAHLERTLRRVLIEKKALQ